MDKKLAKLERAAARALRAYDRKPTEANEQAYNEACSAYDEYVREDFAARDEMLWERYMSQKATP